MKRILTLVLFLMPAIVFAQNNQPMNQQQMQKIMQQMQEMQKCMQQVDRTRMEKMGQRAEQVDAKIKALCAKGARDEAQEMAMAFGKEMLNDPDMKIMRKCTENVKEIMPKMEMPLADLPEDLSKRHVCDNRVKN